MTEPLYKKIKEVLEKEMEQGVYPVGGQLPTEKQLSEKYQVSRITAKRALTELERAGLIFRIQGKGSFVKEIPSSKLSYYPNKANKILFILPPAYDLSVGNFTEGLLPVMQEHQVEVVIENSNFFLNKTADALIKEYNGLIYYAEDTLSYFDVLASLSLKGFPVVSLDKKEFELDFPTILSDNLAGGFSATHFLIQQKHSRIAYFYGNSLHLQSVRSRYLGYLKALEKAKLSFHSSSNQPTEITNDLIDYWLSHNVTAIICENDIVAIKLMKRVKEKGVKIPNDISIIGFDNIQAAHYVEPALTTIAQNFKQIGTLSALTLLKWIQSGKKPQDSVVPVTLVQRKSTTENKNDCFN